MWAPAWVGGCGLHPKQSPVVGQSTGADSPSRAVRWGTGACSPDTASCTAAWAMAAPPARCTEAQGPIKSREAEQRRWQHSYSCGVCEAVHPPPVCTGCGGGLGTTEVPIPRGPGWGGGAAEVGGGGPRAPPPPHRAPHTPPSLQQIDTLTPVQAQQPHGHTHPYISAYRRTTLHTHTHTHLHPHPHTHAHTPPPTHRQPHTSRHHNKQRTPRPLPPPPPPHTTKERGMDAYQNCRSPPPNSDLTQ